MPTKFAIDSTLSASSRPIRSSSGSGSGAARWADAPGSSLPSDPNELAVPERERMPGAVGCRLSVASPNSAMAAKAKERGEERGDFARSERIY